MKRKTAGTTSLHFTERMTGWFSLGAPTFEDGLRAGRAAGSSITFVQTIVVDDLDATLADLATPASLSGYVEAPALSTERLNVRAGSFRLMVRNPDRVETYNMRYEMELEASDGRLLYFAGHKVLTHGPIWRTWRATTTLFVTVREGADDGPVVGRGVMFIKPRDFVRQLGTMRVTGVRGPVARGRALSRFGGKFMGRLALLYAGKVNVVARFAPRTVAPMRPSRLPAADRFWCDGRHEWHEGAPGSDAWLMLTRYRGGSKGPLLMAPGFGMAADSMATPTIDTTLAEYACERGYDAWLFDYRASIDLPSSMTSFTIDEVALTDWPTAVAEVRRRTGADSVQVLGHCVGSVSALMALLAGLEHVRSLVCSQFTVHVVSTRTKKLMVRLHVGHAMCWLRIKTVKPNVNPTLVNRFLDMALVLVPYPKHERCGRPVCRWINSIYGLTHNHAQLNDATHDSFEKAFGVGNMHGIRHLIRIFRNGTAIAFDGQDVYLPHVERLSLPILFVQGARNHIFRPVGTQRTVAWLQANNDPKLYDLLLLPEYAHLDSIVGTNAATDVYPTIFEHLDRTN